MSRKGGARKAGGRRKPVKDEEVEEEKVMGPAGQPAQDCSHVCVLCDARLGSKDELKEHFRKHANGQIDTKGRPTKMTERRPRQPPQEVTAFNNKGGQQQQEKEGGASKAQAQISCDVCEQSFETVTLAIQHKFKKHPKSHIKHYCPHCGKQFPLQVCLVNHINSSHDGKRNSTKLYQCKVCKANFFNMEAINFHFQSNHQRVGALVNPIATLGPSKKIKMNMNGEPHSVYYCHLCGHEYLVKFNLQKHLENNHTSEQRRAPPEKLVKCKLCEAVFYNSVAYEAHNMLHSPADLYIGSEAERKLAVQRVDQDFDANRIPQGIDKYIPVHKIKAEKPVKSHETCPLSRSAVETVKKTAGKNRAIVDSDSDNDKSDTSIESDGEETPPSRRKKARRK